MAKKKQQITPYPAPAPKLNYIFGIADSSLILAQRLSALTGHGPSLETDMALSNIALDLFGQVRMYYRYGAQLADEITTEDELAFLRSEREFRNVLLVEQPNHDFAYVIGRQFLYDGFHHLLLKKLQWSEDQNLASIAKKSIKEVAYHTEFSGEWIKRLGDGTEESHQRMQTALDDLWVYTEELFDQTALDLEMVKAGIGCDLTELKDTYYENVKTVVEEATLEVPELKYFKRGGKIGVHSEHMGHLLTEMQYLQRTYPGLEW